MTVPSHGARLASPAALEKGSEAHVRSLGRAFVLAFCGALRNVRMYPAENPVVQRSLQELTALSGDLVGDDSDLELRIAGEFLFINQTRLRLDLDNYATVNFLITQLRTSGTGLLRASAVPTPAEWTVLVTAINSPKGDDPVSRHHHLHQRLAAAGVTLFELEPPVAAEMGGSDERGAVNDPAKGAYAKSVAAASDVMRAVSIGQSPNLKVVKRTVQLIVDRILSDETSMLGLTTIRDYEDQTFTHAVNVCIFSVALGRRLGLSRVQLYDLGLAALFHDCGKSPDAAREYSTRRARSPTRTGRPSPRTRGPACLPFFICASTTISVSRDDGVLRTPSAARGRRLPEAAAPAAGGVLQQDRLGDRGVRRGHDAPRLQRSPATPAAVVQTMRENAQKYLDPVVVLTFTDMLGAYPVGTV